MRTIVYCSRTLRIATRKMEVYSMFKRIIAMLLLIATLSCLLVPTASAATTTKITASEEKYPTEIKLGSSFGIRGKYTTNVGTITRVEAELKNSNGVLSGYSYKASVNTKTYDVNGTTISNGKDLNGLLTFGKLPIGTYTLVIRLHANGSTSPTYTVNKTFKVISNGTSTSTNTTPTITASNEKYPSNNGQPDIKQGSSFGIRGKYTTNVGTITRVEAEIKNSKGVLSGYSYIANVNTKTYDVDSTTISNGKDLNGLLTFGKLPIGTYTLVIRLHANGSTSPTYTVNKTFKVISNGTSTSTNTTPTITASEESYPTEITQGSKFPLRGKYTTNVGTITSVSATLKNVYGSTTYYTFSASPNATSFDVNGTKNSSGKTLNDTIKFGSLSAGTYTLQINITAKNGTASKTHTVTKTFTVTSTSSTSQGKVYYSLEALPKEALDCFIRMLESLSGIYLKQYNGTYCVELRGKNQYYYLSETALISTCTDATKFVKVTNNMNNALLTSTEASQSAYFIKRSPFETNNTDIRITCVDSTVTLQGNSNISIMATVRASLSFSYNKYSKFITVDGTHYNGIKVTPQYTLESSNLSLVGFNHYYACAYGLEAKKSIDASQLLKIGYQIGTAIYNKDYKTLTKMALTFTRDWFTDDRALYTLDTITVDGEDVPNDSALGVPLSAGGPITSVNSTSPIYLGYNSDYYKVIICANNNLHSDAIGYLSISSCIAADMGYGITKGSRYPTVTCG